MSVLKLYTGLDEIGMDHPLFMVRTQSGIDAAMLFERGVPMEEALQGVKARMQDLFGEDIPLALVDGTVFAVYMRNISRCGPDADDDTPHPTPDGDQPHDPTARRRGFTE